MRNGLNALKKADELVLLSEDMFRLRQRYQKYNKTETSRAYYSSAIRHLDQSYSLIRRALEEENKL